MKSGERKRGQKAELTDLEKADCLTGKEKVCDTQ